MVNLNFKKNKTAFKVKIALQAQHLFKGLYKLVNNKVEC